MLTVIMWWAIGGAVIGLVLGMIRALASLGNREVRCPSCTEVFSVAKGVQNFSCNRCGTPILRGGQFASSQTNP